MFCPCDGFNFVFTYQQVSGKVGNVVRKMLGGADMAKSKKLKSKKMGIKDMLPLYIMLIPAAILVVLFCYIPMYGVLIAFTDYTPTMGNVFNSNWIGFENFRRFFNLYNCWDLIWNTLRISLMGIIFMTPLPIILALAINEIGNKTLKQLTQTISYAPYFVSTIIIAGMTFSFTDRDTGFINDIIVAFGGERTALMESPAAFPWIYLITSIWSGVGWSAIIYVGTLSNVDPNLIEAAKIDGAGRLARIWHINLPVLIPTITLLFIMGMGNILGVGFEKAYLLQTDLNLETSEIISTFVYKQSLVSYIQDYGYGTAIGLLNSVVGIILLAVANTVAKKLGGTTLW